MGGWTVALGVKGRRREKDSRDAKVAVGSSRSQGFHSFSLSSLGGGEGDEAGVNPSADFGQKTIIRSLELEACHCR